MIVIRTCSLFLSVIDLQWQDEKYGEFTTLLPTNKLCRLLWDIFTFQKGTWVEIWRNSHSRQKNETFLFYQVLCQQVLSHQVFVAKFLLCEVTLTQKKLIHFFLYFHYTDLFTNQCLGFLIFPVKFWLGEARHFTCHVHPLRLLWKSDLKTRGFMVLKAKPA